MSYFLNPEPYIENLIPDLERDDPEKAEKLRELLERVRELHPANDDYLLCAYADLMMHHILGDDDTGVAEPLARAIEKILEAKKTIYEIRSMVRKLIM